MFWTRFPLIGRTPRSIAGLLFYFPLFSTLLAPRSGLEYYKREVTLNLGTTPFSPKPLKWPPIFTTPKYLIFTHKTPILQKSGQLPYYPLWRIDESEKRHFFLRNWTIKGAVLWGNFNFWLFWLWDSDFETLIWRSETGVVWRLIWSRLETVLDQGLYS